MYIENRRKKLKTRFPPQEIERERESIEVLINKSIECVTGDREREGDERCRQINRAKRAPLKTERIENLASA